MKKADKQLATVLFNLTEGKEVHELDKIVDEFIRWLAERQLLHRSRKIVLALDQIWKEKFGASSVTVESAHPLTKKTQQHLVEAVKGADLTAIVNPELIGGAKIRVDDLILDGSVSGGLNSLRNFLSEN